MVVELRDGDVPELEALDHSPQLIDEVTDLNLEVFDSHLEVVALVSAEKLLHQQVNVFVVDVQFSEHARKHAQDGNLELINVLVRFEQLVNVAHLVLGMLLPKPNHHLVLIVPNDELIKILVLEVLHFFDQGILGHSIDVIEWDGRLIVVGGLEGEQVEEGLEVLSLRLVLLLQELVGYQLLH